MGVGVGVGTGAWAQTGVGVGMGTWVRTGVGSSGCPGSPVSVTPRVSDVWAGVSQVAAMSVRTTIDTSTSARATPKAAGRAGRAGVADSTEVVGWHGRQWFVSREGLHVWTARGT